MNNIIIAAACRTPMGNLNGQFNPLAAWQLAAQSITGTLAQTKYPKENIEAVILGCVLQAGQGQAPARQASLAAKLSSHIPALTINKMCGSGMQAVMLAHDVIVAGSQRAVLAGGMESMSNAPYLINKARRGYRLGHDILFDHLIRDGLENAYEDRQLMGHFAELTASQYNFTRETQDKFARTSLQRAIHAQEQGLFDKERCNVTVKKDIITHDEGLDATKLAKISRLKPVFNAQGTITAANASSISDGAASLLITTEEEAQKHNLKPLARIVAHSSHAQAPEHFTTAPIGAIKTLLQKTQWTIDSVDLFEINEAFAVVTLAAMHDLKLPHEKVNIHGGACALGHPIGASGARILVTLIHALHHYQYQRGIAALCIGGGEANAMAIERIS